MDFIIDIPISHSLNFVFVVVDCLTKMAHFIPCEKTILGEKIAKLFWDNVYCYHGLPNDVKSRSIVCIQGLEITCLTLENLYQICFYIPPTNKWTNSMCEPNFGTILVVYN
jgi:hypothetical protein